MGGGGVLAGLCVWVGVGEQACVCGGVGEQACVCVGGGGEQACVCVGGGGASRPVCVWVGEHACVKISVHSFRVPFIACPKLLTLQVNHNSHLVHLSVPCAGPGQVLPSGPLPPRVLHLFLPPQVAALLVKGCARGEAEICHQFLQVN